MEQCGVLWGPGIAWGHLEECALTTPHAGVDHKSDAGFEWHGRPTKEELAILNTPARNTASRKISKKKAPR